MKTSVLFWLKKILFYASGHSIGTPSSKKAIWTEIMISIFLASLSTVNTSILQSGHISEIILELQVFKEKKPILLISRRVLNPCCYYFFLILSNFCHNIAEPRWNIYFFTVDRLRSSQRRDDIFLLSVLNLI